jgi:DNA mismatch endonuclease, patch repair protein
MPKALDRDSLFADVPETVRRRMKAVRGKETKPEKALRAALHRLGYRFRKNVCKLPGTPDIAFTSRRKVIFVHGCFWHQHAGCRKATVPKTRQEYWIPKLRRVGESDVEIVAVYERMGWSVMTVWECELTGQANAVAARAAEFLGPVGQVGSRGSEIG